MRRKIAWVFIAVLAVLSASCASLLGGLLPSTAEPRNADSSMLVMEMGTGSPGESKIMLNTNFTGWAPWVVDSRGNIVPFKKFDSLADVDSFYYAENLDPGTYTLKGFFHVYTDYGKLTDDMYPEYGPFEKYPYHVRQEFPLDAPVKFTLGQGTVDSLGHYYVNYQWKEGASGNTDDRWKVVPSSVSIKADPQDKAVLGIMKNWEYDAWKTWAARNPAVPAE